MDGFTKKRGEDQSSLEKSEEVADEDEINLIIVMDTVAIDKKVFNKSS